MRPALAHLALLLLFASCDRDPPPVDPLRGPGPRPTAMTMTRAPAAPARGSSEHALTPAPEASRTRGEVVLVELGPAFPADLRLAVEEALRDELAVDVVWHERIPLPRAAWYAPRKRWRADVLLDHLLALVPDAPASTRVLGLTTKDISTTKGEHHDWGVFGLGLMPGQAAVISSHRLRRGAKDREQLRFRVASTAVHEVGHTFGLDHCPEARCPMQDAQGGIANTDTSTGHLGPQCRAELEAGHPLRDPARPHDSTPMTRPP
jgi:archaemetzincin